MAKAYSEDLRARVLAAVDGGMPAYTAARVFRVSVSYIYKALIRRRMTGEVTARPQRGHCPPKLAAHADRLAQRVTEVPDATLAELRDWIGRELGVGVSITTLWTTLARLGFTYKKSRSGRPSRTGRTWQRLASPGGLSSSTP